jgi:HEAT repeat protein
VTLWIDRLRDVLLPFLWLLASALAILFTWLVVWRLAAQLRTAWRRQVIARYQPLVDELLSPASTPDTVRQLARSPRRYRDPIGSLIIDALRLTTGEIVPRLRDALDALGLIDHWRVALHHRRWWVRADAARALGLVRDPSAVEGLIGALDDPHEEVRAAAVDALGRIGDPRAVPALLARLPDESRHQRTRLVEALRGQGPSIVPALLEYIRIYPHDTALAIDVLGLSGATGALSELLAWTGHPESIVRVAALKAIGSIGLDDRSYYYALRGLEDSEAEVRGMAARALGRSGRQSAVPYLARHLDDEWVVAAHAATGLRRLGREGKIALRGYADAPGQAGVLARQMLWELTALRAA